MIKNILNGGLLLSAMLPMASFAVPMLTVGGLDSYVDAYDFHTFDRSGWTELAGSGGSAWQQVDENSDLWAFDFGSDTPSQFFIKTGGGIVATGEGETDVFDLYIYDNDAASLNWGVIDLSIFSAVNPQGRVRDNVEIGIFSHVRTSGSTSVPEPSTVALLSIGLLGLGLGRRRAAIK